MVFNRSSYPLILWCLLCFAFYGTHAQTKKPKFNVIAFYTAKNDHAHISYVHEANKWFPEMGLKYNFSYDSTSNWSNMNAAFLSHYQVVLFLDTRPEAPEQRAAFRQYMEKGGGWIGFHFAAFALTPSDFPQNWDWYHEQFLGSGSYGSNTWRPTSAILRVEDKKHPVTKQLPQTFKSAPNEWYRWSNDLRTNPDIKILLAVDSSSFPLGTGPKQHEIWHSGYYPVAWTNTKYKMVYINMGHNDMDYEHHQISDLSLTFSSQDQDRFLLNALFYVAKMKF
ncbi:ThuA domain-containing protein [Pedobacter hartonius]|uniref:Trehalose utilisation n=1 Tax=Pedobacter hartonius TaxID=425514 RepID=A0A1H4GIR0_9SPHI|nr:ThuA domain-containing protein [Pedobacter hartonius]SEB09509.1 Trehalose utilisation [Pedobacter hartonius]